MQTGMATFTNIAPTDVQLRLGLEAFSDREVIFDVLCGTHNFCRNQEQMHEDFGGEHLLRRPLRFLFVHIVDPHLRACR